jgi:MFS family permease
MHGLYLLWWVQEKQVSPAVVASVLAAGDLALIGLELPTGWFADRFGHRPSLLLGSFVQVLGMLWCWLGEGVSGLLTASVLVALGDAFRSGANQALLYRTCVAIGREDDFQRIEARTEAVALGALVILVLLGGLVVHRGGFMLGWLAETLLCGAGLAIACLMVEPPSAPARTELESRTSRAVSIPYRSLAAAIAPAAFIGACASATAFLAQTHLTDAVSVTLLVATFTAAEAAGSALASRLPQLRPGRQMPFTMIGGILLFTAALSSQILATAAVGLAFLAGLLEPLRAAAIQRLASDDIRARAASAASACDMTLTAILLPLAGMWRTRRQR